MPEPSQRYDVSHLAPNDVLSVISTLNSTDRRAADFDQSELPTIDYEVQVRFLTSEEWPDEQEPDEEEEHEPSEDEHVSVDELGEHLLSGFAENLAVSDTQRGEVPFEEPVSEVIERDPHEIDPPMPRERDVSPDEEIRLTDEDRARLRDVETDLLQWLEEREENAGQFILDPIDSLERVAPDIDPHLIAKLRRIRERNQSRPLEGPETRITSLTVTNAVETE